MSNIKLYELKKLQTHFPATTIKDSKTAADFIRQFYGDDLEVFESFFVLMLNKANKTIGYAKISQGGIAGTVVDVRIVMKYAVESLATGMIIAHNHPSGTNELSNADRQLHSNLAEVFRGSEIKARGIFAIAGKEGTGRNWVF